MASHELKDRLTEMKSMYWPNIGTKSLTMSRREVMEFGSWCPIFHLVLILSTDTNE